MPHTLINAAKIICAMTDRPFTDLRRIEHTTLVCERSGVGYRFEYLLKDGRNSLRILDLFSIPFLRADNIKTRADVKRLYKCLIYATEGNICAKEICPSLAYGESPVSVATYQSESGSFLFDGDCAHELNNAIHKAQEVWGDTKVDLILFVLDTMYREGYGINHLLGEFNGLGFTNITGLLKHFFHINVTQPGFAERNNEAATEG